MLLTKYLQTCVALMQMMQLHVYSLALQVISSAVGNRAQQLPISCLASWFGCSVADVKVLCTSCGLTVNEDVVSVSRRLYQQPQVRSINLFSCHLQSARR